MNMFCLMKPLGGGKIEQLQSDTITWLRFPLILLVIYIHSFGEDLLAEEPDTGLAIYDNIRIFFSHIISRPAVPSFFVISGFLLFYKVTDFNCNIYWKKMKSRVKTILLPYLLWNVLFIMQTVAFKLGKTLVKHQDADIIGYFSEKGWLNMFWSCNVWPFRTSWFGWELPSSGPILVPMWYLRDLMVCFLLSYVIYRLIKRFGLVYLGFIMFCSISGLWPNIPGLSAAAILYFSMGAYVAINRRNLLVEFSRYSYIVLPTTIVLTLLMIYYKSDFTLTGNYIYPVFVFFGVLSIFIIAGHIVQAGGWLSRQPRILSQSSFFVYAIHTILILGYCSKLINKVLPGESPFIMTTGYLLTPILCAAVCVSIYYLMSRFMHRILGVLTGNRNVEKKNQM